MPQVDGRWGKPAPVIPADGSVTTAKIADNAVIGDKIATDTITDIDIAAIPQPAEANVAMASAVPTQAEVNAIATKVNNILQKLRNGGIITP